MPAKTAKKKTSEFSTPPAAKRTDPESATPEEILDGAITEARTPEEVEQVEELIYSETELEDMWISILQQESYVEKGSLKGKLEYTLTAFTEEEKVQIDHYMDRSDIKLRANYVAMETRCYVALTVTQLGKYSMPDGALDDKLQAIASLPLPLFEIAMKLVGKFNAKISQMLEKITSSDF